MGLRHLSYCKDYNRGDQNLCWAPILKIFGFRHTVSSHGASRTCGAQSRGTGTRASAITNTVLKQCESHGFLIGTLIQGCLACRRCSVHRLSHFLEVFV